MRLHTLEPAYSIIMSFARNGDDGITRVARIVGRTRAAVQRWTYPKEMGGTGGGIPRRHVLTLYFAAIAEGRKIAIEQLAKLGEAEC